MTQDGGESGNIKFCIPFLPPSVNSLYQIIFAQRRVEMKPDVRTWKTKCKEYIPDSRIKALLSTSHDTGYDTGHILDIRCIFTYNWYYKNGKLKKFDTQNLLKVLCDAIAEKCGFDDSLIKQGSWKSVHSESQEQVEVEVSNEV